MVCGRRDRGRAGRRRVALSTAILAASLVAACGQRGPLYLPTPPAEPPPRARNPSSGTVVVPPARTPADGAQPARRTD